MTDLHEELDAFDSAAHWADELVGAIPDSAWGGPGLGDWDLRALVGHTSRALLTVEQYLAMPAEAEEADSAEAYYERAARLPSADPGAVLQRGIDAGADLGEHPAAGFHEIVGRVSALLAGERDQVVTTIVGGIRLSSYLPTRTFELVVHGLDIAHAAGLPASPPAAALRRALELATSLALRSGEGPRLLMAVTGRGGLARGFSVLD